MELEEILQSALQDISELKADWALVGGIAVSARADPRFTRDIDLAIAVRSDQEAEHLVHALLRRGYRLDALVEQTAVGQLATARLVTPYHAQVFLDLLFASSGVEPEVVGAAESIELKPGLRARVAAMGHLIALKVLSRDDEKRPQDRIDLVALLKKATAQDLETARATMKTMKARGFHRNKDLLREFESLPAG